MKTHELEITGLAHDGRGIGFLNSPGSGRGKTVMVAGSLPGQKVLCQITRERDRYCEAETLEIIRETPGQRKPLCPHWRVCGGCPLQLMPPDSQLGWKETLAKEALARIGGMDRELLETVWKGVSASPLETGHRNKVEFAFGFDGQGNPALGFRARSSHEAFPVSDCAAAGPEASAAAPIFYQLALDSGLPFFGKDGAGFWRFLTLRKTSTPDGEKWLALCITSRSDAASRKKTEEAGRMLLREAPFLQAFVHEERFRNDFLPIGQRRSCVLDRDGKMNPEAAIIRKKLLGQEFLLDCAGFFQTNDQGAEILARKISQMDAGAGPMLDLYSGCGAPGLLLAKNHSSVVALEMDAKASRYAEKNAALSGAPNYESIAGDAGQTLLRLPRQQWDLALLDPPRAGLDKNAMAGLLSHDPARIIYVSCNPSTFARDARALSANYEPVEIAGVDLFPQTPHIECVSLWKRKQPMPVLP